MRRNYRWPRAADVSVAAVGAVIQAAGVEEIRPAEATKNRRLAWVPKLALK